MRDVLLSAIKQLNPDTWLLTFSQGGLEVTKSLKRGSWLKPLDIEYAVAKKGREAQNDFAQIKHGKDWKQHIPEAWSPDDEARKKLLAITP